MYLLILFVQYITNCIQSKSTIYIVIDCTHLVNILNVRMLSLLLLSNIHELEHVRSKFVFQRFISYIYIYDAYIVLFFLLHLEHIEFSTLYTILLNADSYFVCFDNLCIPPSILSISTIVFPEMDNLSLSDRY